MGEFEARKIFHGSSNIWLTGTVMGKIYPIRYVTEPAIVL